MLITKTSMLSGITRTIDLPVTEEQMRQWAMGALIQNAMPHLDSDEREFLLSGATREEWDDVLDGAPDPDDIYDDRNDHTGENQ